MSAGDYRLFRSENAPAECRQNYPTTSAACEPGGLAKREKVIPQTASGKGRWLSPV
jgi:hypothetical protein